MNSKNSHFVLLLTAFVFSAIIVILILIEIVKFL